jgi:hypothetical protein
MEDKKKTVKKTNQYESRNRFQFCFIYQAKIIDDNIHIYLLI